MHDVFHSLGTTAFGNTATPVGTLPCKAIFAEMTQLRYLQVSAAADARRVCAVPPVERDTAVELPVPGRRGRGLVCKHLRTLALEDDAEMPALFISAWAEERK